MFIGTVNTDPLKVEVPNEDPDILTEFKVTGNELGNVTRNISY